MSSIRCKTFSLARNNWRKSTIIYFRNERGERLTCVKQKSIKKFQWLKAALSCDVECSMNNRKIFFVIFFTCKISNHVTTSKSFSCLIKWNFYDVEAQTKIFITKKNVLSMISNRWSCCKLKTFNQKLRFRRSFSEHELHQIK